MNTNNNITTFISNLYREVEQIIHTFLYGSGNNNSSSAANHQEVVININQYDESTNKNSFTNINSDVQNNIIHPESGHEPIFRDSTENGNSYINNLNTYSQPDQSTTAIVSDDDQTKEKNSFNNSTTSSNTSQYSTQDTNSNNDASDTNTSQYEYEDSFTMATCNVSSNVDKMFCQILEKTIVFQLQRLQNSLVANQTMNEGSAANNDTSNTTNNEHLSSRERRGRPTNTNKKHDDNNTADKKATQAKTAGIKRTLANSENKNYNEFNSPVKKQRKVNVNGQLNVVRKRPVVYIPLYIERRSQRLANKRKACNDESEAYQPSKKPKKQK